MSIGKLLTIAAAIAAPAAIAHAQTSASTYVMKAGAGDLYEIQSSQLETGSANPKIKAFAEEMVKDHMQSTSDVKAAAMAAKMSPAPPKLNAQQARNIAALKAANGAARDRLYVSQQKTAHNQALALHSGYAKAGTVPSLKMAAGKIAPVVRHHITMLSSI